jgi:selenocysteine lyase/cysteine desulfurase
MAPAWEVLRKDFPAAERYAYLNAAAGSPTPRPVRVAVEAYLRELEDSGDRAWDVWLARRDHVRVQAAKLLGAEPDEIAFCDNTSVGMNLIADLLAEDGPVLSDELEFPTVTLPWVHRGVPVHFVPAVEGILHLESFSEADAPRAATIVVSHVQYSNGCRQDLDAFGRIKGQRRLVVSGSQSVGAFPVDMKGSGIDALATAGHKWLCAGYGAGLVYMSRELLSRRPPHAMGWLSVENPFSFNNREYKLVAAAERTELGCPPFGPIFALGAALDYILSIGTQAIAQRVLELNAYLTTTLSAAGFVVLSPGGDHRSGETLIEIADPKRCARALRRQGVLVTEKPQGIRISTHFYNNEADIDRAIGALREHRDGV